MSKDTINKDLDKTTTAGGMAVYKNNKERKEVTAALANDKDLLDDVRNFIFGGDKEAVSPLADIRKK
jgi:hypothetical protein